MKCAHSSDNCHDFSLLIVLAQAHAQEFERLCVKLRARQPRWKRSNKEDVNSAIAELDSLLLSLDRIGFSSRPHRLYMALQAAVGVTLGAIRLADLHFESEYKQEIEQLAESGAFHGVVRLAVTFLSSSLAAVDLLVGGGNDGDISEQHSKAVDCAAVLIRICAAVDSARTAAFDAGAVMGIAGSLSLLSSSAPAPPPSATIHRRADAITSLCALISALLRSEEFESRGRGRNVAPDRPAARMAVQAGTVQALLTSLVVYAGNTSVESAVCELLSRLLFTDREGDEFTCTVALLSGGTVDALARELARVVLAATGRSSYDYEEVTLQRDAFNCLLVLCDSKESGDRGDVCATMGDDNIEAAVDLVRTAGVVQAAAGAIIQWSRIDGDNAMMECLEAFVAAANLVVQLAQDHRPSLRAASQVPGLGPALAWGVDAASDYPRSFGSQIANRVLLTNDGEIIGHHEFGFRLWAVWATNCQYLQFAASWSY